ncbi:AAA family ATPase [Cognatiyoonia sp. IB215182]|uniref:AAA family ATPase n=1 Tax=Cognatiyoonia sp. IB215182 TaxID=3097353 RepID=UPI002A10F1DC|nr:AAA family ATPase [Cognatiyoonia sp. IB215182]MDX8354683.1 AAA family ATPase [Cognatiyoonia sp. IB215182]
MQRVMICGGPGSGKSTLARILGELTGLPVFHMDQIHWKSGWVERSTDEKSTMCHAVHMQDEWIFEGGHSRTYAERVARADTFVWLDLPVVLRQWRVFRRTLQGYGQSRPDLPDGCPERFNKETLEFWRFIWRTRHTARAKLAAIAANPGHLTVHHLQTRSQVAAFIANLPGKAEALR